ncbi:MAG: acyl-CoA thioesterase [Leptospira sp.]|nr:acyl-CoA thioesterase [Leptospira sp.]
MKINIETWKKPYMVSLPISWGDLDANGHVNSLKYLFYMEEARVRTLSFYGIDLAKMRSHKIGPVISRIEIDYIKELNHPDDVEVESHIEVESKLRLIFIQNIYRRSDNIKVAQASVFWFFMDLIKKRPISWENCISIMEK